MLPRLQVDLRRLQPARPPVLLLGGLNLLRALGHARIPAIVASAVADSPALVSRYCSGHCRIPPLDQAQAAAEALALAGDQLAAALGRPVPLFYGNDDGLNLVARHRELLGARFSIVLNDAPVAKALLDKHRFERFARHHGLPVPRSLEWSEVAGWQGPVLVKPRLKVDWQRSPVHLRLFGGAGKARVFRSGRALALDRLAHQLQHDLVIQECVPGDDRQLWSYHAYADERGAVLAWFIGRKLRTFPALTGASTYLELAHNDELAELAGRMAARIPLKGVFKMDFKQNPHTGEWRLLEINARFNLWHYLGARNGVNLMQVAYAHLVHGERGAAPVRYGTRYRWLSLRLDYRAYRDLAARGQLSASGWLASLLHPKIYDLFAWTDPLPFAAACLGAAKRIPRLTVRFWRWLSTAS